MKLGFFCALTFIFSFACFATKKPAKSCAISLAEKVYPQPKSGVLISEDADYCLANVPNRYKELENFHELIFDPDQGTINRTSIREALAAINLLENFLFKGPITRAPKQSRADFYDGYGHPFDIKLYSSKRTKQGIDFVPEILIKEMDAKLRARTRNLITGEMEAIGLVVDTTYLSKKDLKSLMDEIHKHYEAKDLELIQFVKLPEPIRFLRPPKK
ncbi:MAG: hypothetical protein VX642_00310 [Bdellovibrionota bacterium]|nr:hypothetical protein [Bdellovibrionota bacterium]